MMNVQRESIVTYIYDLLVHITHPKCVHTKDMEPWKSGVYSIQRALSIAMPLA